MTSEEASFAVVYVIAGSITNAYILYLGVGAGTVAPGVSGCNIALAAYIWIIGPWFLVVVACSNSVWVVVMDVDILGLIYFDVGAITFKPGVSGRDILLATVIRRT